LNNVLLESISSFFKPQVPRWACEFTSRHLILAGVDSSRKRVASKTVTALPDRVFASSLSQKNVENERALLDLLKEQIARAGLKGSEICVVIPDDAARITFVNAENLPSSVEERETFVRWKLKKNMPFDVDGAQMSFKVLDSAKNGKGADLLVALSPKSVVEEYENLMQGIDLHAGLVVPSTLAVLNLYPGSKEDGLLVKIAPGCITTTVLQNGIPRFYRRVAEMPLFDAVYPTVMYYQDKLGGDRLTAVTVCGYERDIQWELTELQNKLRVPVRRLGPDNIEDIYKPALGAANFSSGQD